MLNLYLIYEDNPTNPNDIADKLNILGCQCSPQSPKACLNASTIILLLFLYNNQLY